MVCILTLSVLETHVMLVCQPIQSRQTADQLFHQSSCHFERLFYVLCVGMLLTEEAGINLEGLLKLVARLCEIVGAQVEGAEIVSGKTHEKMSRADRKTVFTFPTRSDTNRAVQPQRM